MRKSILRKSGKDCKDLTRIMAAHNVAFAAQASPHNWKDLMTKVKKALATKSRCPTGRQVP